MSPPRGGGAAAEALLGPVRRYYDRRLRAHGPTHRGVDWRSRPLQELRFAQLIQVVPAGRGRPGSWSLNDHGCGCGALYGWLRARRAPVDYLGFDLSEEMIRSARGIYGGLPARFRVGTRPGRKADYAVASGIFNVSLGASPRAWKAHILGTLDLMHATSRRGFAFNCRSSYCEPERVRSFVFYADPCWLFDRCMERYSRDVALLHDYGLREFTILVRK